MKSQQPHATTVLAVRRGGEIVLAADGQVTHGDTVLKANADKLRTLAKGKVIGGFAGATADAFTLFERLERRLEEHSHRLLKAVVALARDWRTDKYLRRLEAMMIVADKTSLLVLSGNGDVLEPEGDCIAIGSGGSYALAAARAFMVASPEADARTVAENAMKIAAEICIYTNDKFSFLSLKNG